jgi:hypothetical protein
MGAVAGAGTAIGANAGTGVADATLRGRSGAVGGGTGEGRRGGAGGIGAGPCAAMSGDDGDHEGSRVSSFTRVGAVSS